MSQIYLWQFTGTSQESACARFNDILKKLTAFYNTNLTSNCEFRSVVNGDIIVGQISNDLGILNWNPWLQKGSKGCAWSGVCEDYLGAANTTSWLNEFVDDVTDHPERIAELTGSFSVCAWDTNTRTVAIATGATQHQTLWLVKGPNGWAIGSRARIALLLAGHSLEMDSTGVGLFLSYGYLFGRGSLFKNTERIQGRQHILFRQHEPPQQKTYISLSDYIGKPVAKNFNEAVEVCADHLKKRVKKQLAFSRNPSLSLTGGRDSRCIAAALSNADFNGNVISYNLSNDIDAKIALKISKMLNFQYNTLNVDQLDLLSKYRSRAQLFIKCSEGIETIRHNLINQHFFENENYTFDLSTPIFIGHHAGLQKPITDWFSPHSLNKKIGSHLKIEGLHSQSLKMKQDVDAELESLGTSKSRWSELYLWQHFILQWGQDNMTVRDLFNWWWTPLFDRKIIQVGWHLPETYQASLQFIEAVTLKLAPQLDGLAYDHSFSSSKSINNLRRRIKSYHRKMDSILNRIMTRKKDLNYKKINLWKGVLFNTPDTTWKEWIDEDHVLKLIKERPDNALLWNTITVQLFKEAFFPK